MHQPESDSRPRGRAAGRSVGLVADLMRELGLAAVQPRAYKRTTVAGEHPVSSPDLIGRDFTADAPDGGWSAHHLPAHR